MDMELINMQMVIVIKAILKQERNLEEEIINGEREINIQETGKMIC